MLLQIRQFSTEVIAETASDIDEVSIVQKLRAAGGANVSALHARDTAHCCIG